MKSLKQKANKILVSNMDKSRSQKIETVTTYTAVAPTVHIGRYKTKANGSMLIQRPTFRKVCTYTAKRTKTDIQKITEYKVNCFSKQPVLTTE